MTTVEITTFEASIAPRVTPSHRAPGRPPLEGDDRIICTSNATPATTSPPDDATAYQSCPAPSTTSVHQNEGEPIAGPSPPGTVGSGSVQSLATTTRSTMRSPRVTPRHGSSPAARRDGARREVPALVGAVGAPTRTAQHQIRGTRANLPCTSGAAPATAAVAANAAGAAPRATATTPKVSALHQSRTVGSAHVNVPVSERAGSHSVRANTIAPTTGSPPSRRTARRTSAAAATDAALTTTMPSR